MQPLLHPLLQWRQQPKIDLFSSNFKSPISNQRLNLYHIQCPGGGGHRQKLTKMASEEMAAVASSSDHQVTGQPGSKRLYEQVNQRYYSPDIRRYIDNLNCVYYWGFEVSESSGSSLGALWELSGSSLGARCSCAYSVPGSCIHLCGHG